MVAFASEGTAKAIWRHNGSRNLERVIREDELIVWGFVAGDLEVSNAARSVTCIVSNLEAWVQV